MLMTTPADVELQLTKLDLKKDSVLVLKGNVPRAVLHILSDALKRLDREDVLVINTPPGQTVSVLDEVEMAKAGWMKCHGEPEPADNSTPVYPAFGV